MQEILGGSLGLHVVGDDLVKVQQFNGVWIDVGRSNHLLYECLSLRLVNKKLSELAEWAGE